MLKSAQAFVDALTKAKLKYKQACDLEDGKSLVICGFNGKHNARYDVFLAFDADGESVCIRALRLLEDCPEDKTLKLLDTINEINVKYRWLKLYLDKNQNISVQIDAYVNDSAENNICLKLLLRMVNIIDEFYPMLMHTLWA